MKIKFFTNVKTLEELKKQYKKLAMQYHPDCGGDEESMKVINNEYDFLFKKYKNVHVNKDGEYYEKENTEEAPEEWRETVDRLLKEKMIDVKIEVIGSFLWVSGNTKPYKELLKELKFRWSTNKNAWYLAPLGYKKRNGKIFDMEDIRDMYGSKAVRKKTDEEKEKKKITA